jgi:L-alanine-DL-glutamate epimerase-like enolase superfamily enzyme
VHFDAHMAPIERLVISAYTIPTDLPESDGTIEWDSTTMVLVEAHAGGKLGVGYTYGDPAIGSLIKRGLAPIVVHRDAFSIPAIWADMVRRVRNTGRPGIGSMAIAAVDSALWDLKARLLDVPLVTLLGSARDGIPIYGSGGFTSYPVEQLESQLSGWVQAGINKVKMKVGRNPEKDLERVSAGRRAIGDAAKLFVDANGAYTRKQALDFANAFAKFGVTWFEEPVSSDDVEGLHLIRDRAPAGMDIAAGEYGYHSYDFRRLLDAGAVDILQIDATRCGGITGFLKAAELADAYSLGVSAHTAPALHLHICCSVHNVVHIEYFHDHVRIEEMLFEGNLKPVQGMLYPDTSRPGNGLELKRGDAARFAHSWGSGQKERVLRLCSTNSS